MKKVKNNTVFLIIVILLIVIIAILLNKTYEGFYSNNSITSAKTSLTDLQSNQVSNIMNILKDINANKYSLDVTSAIGSLGEEMKNSSDNSRMFILKKKAELSNLQKNLNNINKVMALIPNNTIIEQIVVLSNEKSTQNINLLDAINNINTQLRNISMELSEIPE